MNAHVLDSLNALFFDTAKYTAEDETSDAVLETQVIHKSEKFDDLAQEWNTLLQLSSVDNVFLTHEWCSTWWKHFQDNCQLYLITIRHKNTGQLLGLAPLHISESRSMLGLSSRKLSFLGHGTAAPDHLDFIIHPDYEQDIRREFTNALWQHREEWDEISFDGMLATSPVVYTLLQQHPHLMKQIVRSICPYLNLPASWDEYLQSQSRNMRYKLGRFQRRLEKDYPKITTLKRHDNASSLNKFMPDLFNLHTMAQRRLGNEGSFTDPKMQEFHIEIANHFAELGWLRAYSLDIGDTSIAALYCYQYNNTVYFYQSGFDLFWRRYSPGSQIMAHAIKSAIEEGAEVFDFLRGEEDYKFEWTKTYKTNVSVMIPFGIHKQLELIMRKARNRIKRRVQL